MKEVINKFKFKSDAVVINAPVILESEFAALGFKTSFEKKLKSANTLVFINYSKDYFLNGQVKNIEPDSVLWFAYPKGNSKSED